MHPRPPRVFTVSPELDPLRIIARHVLSGALLDTPSRFPLHAWTIFLPNRRAARRLGDIFFEEAGGSGVLLPRLQPIGDLDDTALEDWPEAPDVPRALTEYGTLFETVKLVHQWARQNVELQLAQDISVSPALGLRLARSLADLLAQCETEEIPAEAIPGVYEFPELAGHREAIVGLLQALHEHLKEVHSRETCIGAAAHRNAMIRAKAAQITAHAETKPVIAAGSAGTNPATRELLSAIAHAPFGALILPGLDPGMDDADWIHAGPTHPQHGLKQLVEKLKFDRSGIVPLKSDQATRTVLLREIMRPTERTHLWAQALKTQRATIAQQTDGVHLLAADDRHVEARAIALVMREALETPGRTAALITPDRELAKRVKAELQRWQIEVNDSAGEPLSRFGMAALIKQIIVYLQSNYGAAALTGLLHHGLLTCGLPPATYREAAQAIDVAVLRQQGAGTRPEQLVAGYERAKANKDSGSHVHPVVKRLSDQTWSNMGQVLNIFANVFADLESGGARRIDMHIEALVAAAERLSGAVDWTRSEDVQLRGALDALGAESGRLGAQPFALALQVILDTIETTVFRQPDYGQSRLAIYGLLEARMMAFDIAILGGLNEGKWPAQADPGPWLNRPMRETLKMQQPERAIGQTAHDFCEAMGHAKAYLTWSMRAGREPLVASRWILRLQMILSAVERSGKDEEAERVLQMARWIDFTREFKPWGRPAPRPPVRERPTRFSVTAIETLIRDPYAIYAREILGLRPLEQIAGDFTARDKGTVFHAALENWSRLAQNKPDEPANLQALIAEGRQAFAQLDGNADAEAFWWPRFQRLAEWMHAQDRILRRDVVRSIIEATGSWEFMTGGVKHVLRARADRIDILSDGQARIIDYKTGRTPSDPQVKTGLSPQLTLEAALLALGGFKDVGARAAKEALYLHVTGANPAGEIKRIGSSPKNSFDLMQVADEHFQLLQKKLASFQIRETAYPPRSAFMATKDLSDYDHLSRLREWSLNGNDATPVS